MGSFKNLTYGETCVLLIFYFLNRYSKNSNYFLQVSFLDENGESIWHDRVVSNEEIYLFRFKKVLEGVINVAGRGYEVSNTPAPTVLMRGLTLGFCILNSFLGFRILLFGPKPVGSWPPLPVTSVVYSTLDWLSVTLEIFQRFDRRQSVQLGSDRPFRRRSAQSPSHVTPSKPFTTLKGMAVSSAMASAHVLNPS